MTSRILKFLTCVDEELLNEFELDNAVRDQVKICMTEHTTGTSTDVVRDVIRVIRTEQRYDMSEFVLRVRTQRMTAPEWDALLVQEGIDALQLEELVATRATVKFIPRFAAASIVALRSKFGVLENTDANRLLIQREYLRVCREANVRACDTESHRQHVMNGFFSEFVLSQLGTVRMRVPSWMRQAFGGTPATVGPVVC